MIIFLYFAAGEPTESLKSASQAKYFYIVRMRQLDSLNI